MSFFPSYELLCSEAGAQQNLHERAAHTARATFGRKVFVRGVVEVSNFCRENCAYCGMRRDNRTLVRHRARLDQLTGMLLGCRPGSITDINIQAGEDPVVVREVVLPLIAALRRETSLGISVCLGTLNPAIYQELLAAGASVYIIKFEIADPALFRKMAAPGSLPERVENIQLLARSGWAVSSGFIVGLPGQGETELLANFALAKSLPIHGCSVSPFIPGEETPLAQAPTANLDLTLNCMAALRLMRPDWIIPAVSALNLAGPDDGYRRGLRTGANLVTMNLTPQEVRDDYVIYKRDRFIMTEERILSAIAAEGLIPARGSLAQFYREQALSLRTSAGTAETVVAA